MLMRFDISNLIHFTDTPTIGSASEQKDETVNIKLGSRYYCFYTYIFQFVSSCQHTDLKYTIPSALRPWESSDLSHQACILERAVIYLIEHTAYQSIGSSLVLLILFV
jgi:hypothetical protein